MSLRWRALAGVALFGLGTVISGCSGGGGGSGSSSPPSGSTPPPPPPLPPPPPPPPTTQLDDEGEVVRFLTRSTFGARRSEIAALVGQDASDWFQAELLKAPSLILPDLLTQGSRNDQLDWNAASNAYWNQIIAGDDQLRQRMAFALSQIIVVSDASGSVLGGQPLTMAGYMDIMTRNAFGNYRDLLEEVTYSPAMAQYLTYIWNEPEDPDSGRVPDENYSREIMQLFTIGLVELNADGTPRLDGQGREIPTYDNEDIGGLARVFTGLAPKGPNFWHWPPADDAWYSPLQAFPDYHSGSAKTFLGLTIPAGTGPQESIDLALDHLFNHPNTAPFLSRQLIQRFVTSDPDPAYVARVAAVFDAGSFTLPNGDRVGTGQRGDLSATLAAVLFDPSVADLEQVSTDPDFGKVREPVIRFVNWARAFEAAPVMAENEWAMDLTSGVERLGQHPYRSPSVFNFYRPGYVAPGTATGEAGLTAPELQIVNESTAVGYVEFLTWFIRNETYPVDEAIDSFRPDYTAEAALASDPAALVDHLDTLLTGGRLDPDARARIIEAISAQPIEMANEQEHRLRRVMLAVLMFVTAPEYLVQN